MKIWQDIIQIEKVMSAGDKIIVTTNVDNKNIVFIEASTGKESNINYLKTYESKFLQIPTGINTFRSGAEDGEDNLETVIEFCAEFEAV